MEKYEAIHEHIRRARIERSIYLADLLSDLILDSWKGITNIAEILFSVARARPRKGVFTFDA